jgi:hypothetical protein
VRPGAEAQRRDPLPGHVEDLGLLDLGRIPVRGRDQAEDHAAGRDLGPGQLDGFQRGPDHELHRRLVPQDLGHRPRRELVVLGQHLGLHRMLEQQLGAQPDHAHRGVEPGPEQQHRHAELLLLAGPGLAGGHLGQQVVLAPAAPGQDRRQPLDQLLPGHDEATALVGRGELLEDHAHPTGQLTEPDRLVVVDGQQAAEGQRREGHRQLLDQVDGAGTEPGQPLDEQVRDLVQLDPERADLPGAERAGGDLLALAVRRAGQHHHRAEQAADERVLPPARVQGVELRVGRRPERRVAQQPGTAGVGSDQVAGRHPGEADGQERSLIPQLGVERVRVGQRARPDQPQEDPQCLRLGGAHGRPGGRGPRDLGGQAGRCPPHPATVTGSSSYAASVAQNSSSASASSAGCSMLGLCDALGMIT